MSAAPAAVLLVSHGTVASLDELPAFLTSIRRGHAPSDELLAEVRRRYEVIGGVSPLRAINESLAKKLAARSGRAVYAAARHGSPPLADVLAKVVADGHRRLMVLPLAQHSAPIYVEATRALAEPLGLELVPVANWGQHPSLLALYASKLEHALAVVAKPARVLLSAHSLPRSVIEAGDPYEREVRAAAEAIARIANVQNTRVVFQSQGMGTAVAWLGPDLDGALRDAAGDGETDVIVAPVGFLADHVEILYDLDVEAKARAEELGLGFTRTESLNDDNAFVSVLQHLVDGDVTSHRAADETP